MSESVHTFTLESYFPKGFIIFGTLLIVAGIGFAGSLTTGGIVISIPLFVLGLTLTTTRSGTQLSTEKQQVIKFTKIGLTTFKKKPEQYQVLHGLRLVPQKYSQTMHSRGSSSTIHFTQYNVYLLLDDNSQLLFGGKKEQKMVRRGQALAEKLGVTLEMAYG